MSPPTSPPTYLYKIIPSTSPPSNPLPTILPLSPLDAKDGFIHLSTSSQILRTLNRFFPNGSHVYILRVPYTRVERFIKWESPEGKEIEEAWSWREERAYFPHIYGNAGDGKGCKLGNEDVQDWGRWNKGTEAWKGQDWPFPEDQPVS